MNRVGRFGRVRLHERHVEQGPAPVQARRHGQDPGQHLGPVRGHQREPLRQHRRRPRRTQGRTGQLALDHDREHARELARAHTEVHVRLALKLRDRDCDDQHLGDEDGVAPEREDEGDPAQAERALADASKLSRVDNDIKTRCDGRDVDHAEAAADLVGPGQARPRTRASPGTWCPSPSRVRSSASAWATRTASFPPPPPRVLFCAVVRPDQLHWLPARPPSRSSPRSSPRSCPRLPSWSRGRTPVEPGSQRSPRSPDASMYVAKFAMMLRCSYSCLCRRRGLRQLLPP